MLQKTSLISGVDHWLHALCCVVTGQNTSERRSNRPFRASYRGEIDHVKGWIYGGDFFFNPVGKPVVVPIFLVLTLFCSMPPSYM